MHTLSHTDNIRINFFDADPLGIVWHGNYLKYFEIARESFGRKYGISYLDFKKNGLAVPIVETQTKHKHPLKYGDTAIIKVDFINNEAAKLVFLYTITNESNQLICEGKTIQVFTDLETGELELLVPDFFKHWKNKHGF